MFLDSLDLPSSSPSSYDRLEPEIVQTIRESDNLLRGFEKRREEKQSSSEKAILKTTVQQLCCKGMLSTLQMLAQELSEETFATELTDLDEEIIAYSNKLLIIIAKQRLQVQSI
jgi:hypothetical protein